MEFVVIRQVMRVEQQPRRSSMATYRTVPIMKVPFVLATLFAFAAELAREAQAQVVAAYQPTVTYYAPAPVTTYYAPATSYYAPKTYYATPYTTYYAPRTTYYVPATSYYAPVYRRPLFPFLGWRFRRGLWGYARYNQVSILPY